MSFVFYDTETTGTDTSFDQVLQFAAVRTDADLNELDAINVRCRLLPHIVPSPGALRVTRVRMESLLDPARPTHYEMVCEIRAVLERWSPCVFAGWNSLNFDEHLLRQSFYQCLHPPYLTNTGGNCRIDLMKLAQAASYLEPHCISVPSWQGQPLFKLDKLAPANGFDHSDAHDALADVRATLHVARLLRDRAPDLWSNALRFSQKAAVAAFIEEEPVFVLTEHYFNRPHQFVVTKIGHEPNNEGVVYAFDLQISPAELRGLDDAKLRARLSKSRKPVRRIRTNSVPVLHCIDEISGGVALTAEEASERATEIAGDPGLCARIVDAFSQTREARQPSEDVEEQIYAGFVSRDDEARMAAFHDADWEERRTIVLGFDDERLKELGHRVIFHHRPDLLDPQERRTQERKLARRLSGVGCEPRWMTLATAGSEAEKLMGNCSDEERAILQGMRAYIAERSEYARQLIAGFGVP